MKTPNPFDRYEIDARRHARRYHQDPKTPWGWIALILALGIGGSPPVTAFLIDHIQVLAPAVALVGAVWLVRGRIARSFGSGRIPWVWMALIMTVGVMASPPVTSKIKGAIVDAQTRHSLAVLASNFPEYVLAQAQTGTINAANTNLTGAASPGGSAVQWTLPASSSASTIGVQGTYSATLVIQVSADGTNWVTIPNTSYTKVTTGGTGAISGSGIWTVPTSGAYARVTCSSYVSGSAVVTGIPYSAGSSASGGGGGGGSVTQGTTPWVTSGNGIAGTADSGVMTVQGIASMTPLSVSFPSTPTVNLGTLNGAALDSSLTTANGYLSTIATASTTNGLKDSGGTEMTRTGPHSLSVTGVADTTGGAGSWNNTGAAVTTAVNVSSGAANLYKCTVFNTSTSTGYYLEFFNVDSASVTLGTTVPIWVEPVPSSSVAPNGIVDTFTMPISFSTKISVAAVTAPYGNTAAPATTVYPQVEFK